MDMWRSFKRTIFATVKIQYLGSRVMLTMAIHPKAYLRDEYNFYILVGIPRVLEQPVSDLKASKRATQYNDCWGHCVWL